MTHVPQPDEPPISAVPVTDGLLGLAGLACGWTLAFALSLDPFVSVWCVLLGTSLPMLWAERRRLEPGVSTPLGQNVFAWSLGTLLLLCLAYLVHAQDGSASKWIVAAGVVAPAYLLRAALFERSTWFSGAATQFVLWLARRGPRPDRTTMHMWALKAFFIPIYAVSLLLLVRISFTVPLDSAGGWLVFGVTLSYIVDLSFALAGYVFASNNLVPTIRSTNPLLLGWIVCMICYPPFAHHWPSALQVAQLEIGWPGLASGSSDWIVLAGAGGMVAAMAIYIPATVVFGLRFSNLTNRGVVTSGPYRWLKHPAYLAHIVNAWIIVGVFLPASGAAMTWQVMAVPAAYTVLYCLRMRTEEAHMRSDSDYRLYEAWLDRHGLQARLGSAAGAVLKTCWPRTRRTASRV